MNKVLINILGPGRTGSTILHLMLANNDSSFAAGELYALKWPWRSHHFHPKCFCNKSRCIWSEFSNIPDSEIHSKIFKDFDYIVDESKFLPWVLDTNIWARHSNFKVMNVLLFKDLEEHIFSWWKRGFDLDRFKTTVFYSRSKLIALY